MQSQVKVSQFQRDEQAAHTAVAIKEWVNGLELIMSQGSVNQWRQHAIVKELFPRGEVFA